MRKVEEVPKLVHQLEFPLVSPHLSLAAVTALEKLIENSGFEVYTIYIHNLIKTYELGLQKKPE